jgi:hypothetical protein
VTMTESVERAERRARQKELADRLKAAGALDGIFEQIDAGQVPLAGDDGLLQGLLKAALERDLEVELTDHVGYERGDPEASLFPNSRNGTTPRRSPARSATLTHSRRAARVSAGRRSRCSDRVVFDAFMVEHLVPLVQVSVAAAW